MGQQAVYVGRPREGVDLARVAQTAARRAGVAALLAECHLLEAHGHACLVDRRACSTSLRDVERVFERRLSGEAPPEWLSYFDEAYFAARTAHCFHALGDDAQTTRYARRSLRMNNSYVRGRAFNLSILASSHVRTEPIEAARIASQSLELVEGLVSARAVSYLRDLSHRLRPHARIPEVADFHARSASLTAAG